MRPTGGTRTGLCSGQPVAAAVQAQSARSGQSGREHAQRSGAVERLRASFLLAGDLGVRKCKSPTGKLKPTNFGSSLLQMCPSLVARGHAEGGDSLRRNPHGGVFAAAVRTISV